MRQPYEADLGHLPTFYVAGRYMWTARVLFVCFCIVETHHLDCVLRQFGLAQEKLNYVVYDDILHGIDLRGKVDKIGGWSMHHISLHGILDNNNFAMHLLKLVRCSVIMTITVGIVQSLEIMSIATTLN